MKNQIDFKELSIDYLQQEDYLRFEQLATLFYQGKKTTQKLSIASYKIFFKALRRIEMYLDRAGYTYCLDANERGSFLQFSYDVYMILNAEMRPSIQVMYASKSEEFGQDYVRIYRETRQALPHPFIQKYQSWIGKI